MAAKTEGRIVKNLCFGRIFWPLVDNCLLHSHISQVALLPPQIVKSNGRVYQKNMTLFKTDPLKNILVEGLSNLQSLKSLYSEFKLPCRQFYRPFIAYYVCSLLCGREDLLHVIWNSMISVVDFWEQESTQNWFLLKTQF